MNWSRRRFFAAGAASGLAAGLARRGLAQGGAAPRTLRAGPAMARLAPAEFPRTPVWAYDGQTPGPELRVRQGERVRVLLDNALPQASTIHWHGVRIDNRMDGVAGLTQAATEPGAQFLYDFTAPDAGTFWYHPHNRGWEQVARGLYGALIVEESEPPAVDRDLTLVADDWRLNDDGAIDEASFGAMMDWSHAGRLGNWPTLNGAPRPEIPAKRNERLRLRLINTANATIMTLRLDGAEGWLMALDGQPITPREFDRVTLTPAQRADVIVDMIGPETPALWLETRGEFRLATFPLTGEARAERLAPPAPLPPNPLARELDLAAPLEVELLMQGGAMGGLEGARIGARAHHEGPVSMDGASMGGAAMPEGVLAMRDLVGHGFVWAFNGVAGMPGAPLFAAPLGRTVRLRLINDTAWPHAIHLHGHHVRTLLRRPTEASLGAGPAAITSPDPPDAWRDTVLTAPGETVEIGFVADNPGDWMLHCHMLEHQAGGMGTWFRVG